MPAVAARGLASGAAPNGAARGRRLRIGVFSYRLPVVGRSAAASSAWRTTSRTAWHAAAT